MPAPNLPDGRSLSASQARRASVARGRPEPLGAVGRQARAPVTASGAMCPSEDRSAPVPDGRNAASSAAAGSWLPRFEELAPSAEAESAAAMPRAFRAPAPQRHRGKTRQISTLSLMPRRRARRGFKTPRPCTTISAPVSTGQSRAVASRRDSRNSRAPPRTRRAADLQRKGGRDYSHRGALPRVETFGGPAGLAGRRGRGGQSRSLRGRRPDPRRHRDRDRLGRRR